MKNSTDVGGVQAGHGRTRRERHGAPPAHIRSGTAQAAVDERRQTKNLSGEAWQAQAKRTEAHKLLSEIYNWFTEGFDIKDLQEAKALLDELA